MYVRGQDIYLLSSKTIVLISLLFSAETMRALRCASAATFVALCLDIVLLLTPCCSATSVATGGRRHRLFLMAATHSTDVFTSSTERWDINNALKQQVNDNMNGEMLFAAALQLEEGAETQWDSGMGSLDVYIKDNQLFNSETFSLNCVYMSVSGADGKYSVSKNITGSSATAAHITPTRQIHRCNTILFYCRTTHSRSTWQLLVPAPVLYPSTSRLLLPPHQLMRWPR